MTMRIIKYGLVGTAGVFLVSGLFFGRDAMSYLRSSARSVQSAVKDTVPIEFELQRARDLLEDIIPEMHANIRLIAQEEVQIASLKEDVQQGKHTLDQQRVRLTKLRDTLAAPQVTYTLSGCDYTHQQVKQELAHSFDRYKEVEIVLSGKERLLETREKSLQAAVQMLDRTKSRKVRLEDQIEALKGQYRLVQAASVGSRVEIDHSKLAQTEKLIRQIKNRLDIAERVLAHEARFVQPMAIDTIDEKELLLQVDEHLNPDGMAAPTSAPALATTADRTGL